MTSRRRWTTVALGVLVMLAGTGAGFASAATTATPPPWQVPTHLDPNEVGTLSLYDTAGHAVTNGSINDLPLSAYQLGSAVGRAGDNKATLFAATPAFGVAPGAWPLSQMSTASTFPNAAAPPALAASTFPLHSSTNATDFSLSSYIAAHPNSDTTHPYVGAGIQPDHVLELRL